MILHITNDYSGSTVYKNLVAQLDKKEFSQIIYNPIREVNRINKNKIDFSQKGSKIIYSHILNSYTDRILYQKKIHKIVKDIERQVDLSKITFIHAHTWYSDGGVAYLLHKKYNIPYMVAIRSTDIKVFYKFFLHERNFGKQILLNANNIAVISKAYYYKLLHLNGLKDILTGIQSKLKVIPNGVDCFWIENNQMKKSLESKVINVLYLGNFIQRKHLLDLQYAIINLNKKQDAFTIHLNIVGDAESKYATKIKELAANNQTIMTHYGWINEKEKLLKIIRDNHVFAMTSIQETFGLVYIEALLQGLPILYTKNEGIDGYYDEKIGEKVNTPTVSEIEDQLHKIIRDYKEYDIPLNKLLENHNWKNIANIYQEIYNE